MTPFLADEHISSVSVRLLRDAGYDVISIGEDFPSILDTSILDLANREGRVLITCDSDFGELIYRRQLICQTGVVYFRLGRFNKAEPGELILKYESESPDCFIGRFSVVRRKKLRQRFL